MMDIEEIREIDGEDLGGVLGYFTRGHIDKQQFAIAVNQEFELADQGSYASVSGTEHLYMIKVPIGYSGMWRMVTSNAAKQGYTPITLCNIN